MTAAAGRGARSDRERRAAEDRRGRAVITPTGWRGRWRMVEDQ